MSNIEEYLMRDMPSVPTYKSLASEVAHEELFKSIGDTLFSVITYIKTKNENLANYIGNIGEVKLYSDFSDMVKEYNGDSLRVIEKDAYLRKEKIKIQTISGLKDTLYKLSLCLEKNVPTLIKMTVGNNGYLEELDTYISNLITYEKIRNEYSTAEVRKANNVAKEIGKFKKELSILFNNNRRETILYSELYSSINEIGPTIKHIKTISEIAKESILDDIIKSVDRVSNRVEELKDLGILEALSPMVKENVIYSTRVAAELVTTISNIYYLIMRQMEINIDILSRLEKK